MLLVFYFGLLTKGESMKTMSGDVISWREKVFVSELQNITCMQHDFMISKGCSAQLSSTCS